MISDLLSVLDPDTVRRYRAQIVRSVVYAVLEGVTIALTLPVLTSVVDGDLDSALRWAVVLVVAAAVTLIAHAHTTRKGTRATFDAMAAVQSLEIDKLRSVPLSWFGATHNAELISLLWPGAISITRNILLNLGELARGLITPVIVLVTAAFISPAAALVMLIAAPVMYLVHRATTRRLEEAERTDHRANTEATARIVEYAEAQPTLRTADQDDLGMRLLRDALDELDTTASAGVRTEILARAGFGSTVNLAITAIVATVGIAVLDSGSDRAALVALLTLALRFAEPLMAVAATARMLRTSRATVERTVDFLRTPSLPEPVHPVAIPDRAALPVVLTDVSFRYPGDDAPVLSGIDITVPAGTTTAVVGPSGAGKSTLLRLIPRMADVTDGAIRLGGVDVRDAAPESLYAKIGLVLPEVALLDRSIRDNVTAFRPDATPEELARAAALSGVDEIVERIDGGWDALVGPRGQNLSGGERQRLLIARVALQDPAVVVLDEATSALDPLSENRVQQWVGSLSGRCTVIVVAHRLHLVDSADQVVVLDEGRIVESGPPAALIAADGAFARSRRVRHDTRGRSEIATGPANHERCSPDE